MSKLRRILMTIFALVVVLPLLVLVAAQFGAFAGSPPADLGVKDGRLKPPSRTPNSVTSQAGLHSGHPMAQRAAIAPLAYSGDGRAAMRKLATVLQGLERTTLVRQEADYLYAQCQSRLMRFTDDVEFWLDEKAGVIHVRSASRIGHGDRGVNRARVEMIRHRMANS